MAATFSNFPTSTSASSPARHRARGTVISLLIAALLFTGTTACVTDPYTGERRISKTALGGLFGAGLGAGRRCRHRRTGRQGCR